MNAKNDCGPTRLISQCAKTRGGKKKKPDRDRRQTIERSRSLARLRRAVRSRQVVPLKAGMSLSRSNFIKT